MSAVDTAPDKWRQLPMTPPEPTRQPRLIELDVLRGLAILLVLGRHTPFYDARAAGRLRPLASYWYRFGWTGVDLFFVLSGFLIGSLLFRELRTHTTLDVRRFWIRRLFKIWPPYFTYLVFVWCAELVNSHASPIATLRALLPNLCHLQNYLGTPREHTWSLAVEEHFYLLLPLVLLGLQALALHAPRPRPASPRSLASLAPVPIVGGVLIVLCTGWRCWTYLHYPFAPFTQLYPTHLRIDALFCGVVLAYWHQTDASCVALASRHPTGLLILCATLVLPMLVLKPDSGMFVPTVGLTMLYLGYGCLLLAMVSHAPSANWLHRLSHSYLAQRLARVGYYSYPIYLWHLDLASKPVHWLMEQHLTKLLRPEIGWTLGMAVYIALATATGFIMARLVEQPSLQLRDRLFPAQVTVRV